MSAGSFSTQVHALNQTLACESYHIPQEIVDLIVHEISHFTDVRTSRQTLVACTTVSHGFSLSARTQLYSELWVGQIRQKYHSKDDQKSHHNLFRSIKEDPRILSSYGSLIRKVHIDLSNISVTLTEDDTGLHSALNTLKAHASNVSCFWITGVYGLYSSCWPDLLNLGGAKALVSLLSSWSQLVAIRISHFAHLTMDFLPSLTSVSCLELIGITFDDTELSGGDQAFTSLPLHELSIQRSINGFQGFRKRLKLDLSCLRRFQISVFDYQEALAFSMIIQKSLKSLQTLHLVLRTDHKFLEGGPINIGQFSELQKLRLQIQTGTSQIMSSMCDIFSLLHPPSLYPTRLESIQILLNSVRGPGKPGHTFVPIELNEEDAVVWRSISPTHLLRIHPQLCSLHLGLDLMLMDSPRVFRTSEVLREDEILLTNRLTETIQGSSGQKDDRLTVEVVVWEYRTFRRVGQ